MNFVLEQLLATLNLLLLFGLTPLFFLFLYLGPYQLLLHFGIHLNLGNRLSYSLFFLKTDAVFFEELFFVFLCKLGIVLLRKLLAIRLVSVPSSVRKTALLGRGFIAILAEILGL